MVTMVVVVSVVGGTINTWLKTRSHSTGASASGDSAQLALQREIAELRKRVVTLESIVTEPSFELRRQIESLESRERRAA